MPKELDHLDYPIIRARHHLARAEKVLREGGISTRELERILKELNRASSLKSNDIEHYIGYSEVYKRAVDISSVIFALRLVVKLDPGRNKIRLLLCEMLLERGQEMMKLKYYDQALHYFDEALLLDSSRSNVWFLKTVCLVYQRKFQDALEAIDRNIHLTGVDDENSLILRAKIYWALDMIDAGNKDMRKVMVLSPDHPEVKGFVARSFVAAEKYYNTALQLQAQGDYASAIDCIKKILLNNREDVKLLVLLARLYRNVNQLPEAYQTLTDAADLFKKLEMNGVYPMVKVPLEITHQMNLVLNEMAYQEAVVGRYQEAVLLLNKAIASERRLQCAADSSGVGGAKMDYKFFMNRGDCYRVLQDHLFAIADYKCALQLKPGDGDISTKLSFTRYNLATQYFNEAKFAAAEEQLTASIELNPTISEYYAIRGRARYYQGSYQLAFEDYRHCLLLNPSDSDTLTRIKQFDSNYGMDTDADSLSLEPLRRQSSASRVAQVRKASRPRKVALPVGSLLSSGSAKSLSSGPAEEEPPPLLVSHASSLLPSINPHLATVLVAHEMAKPRFSELKAVTHTKASLKKGSLWDMMNSSSMTNESAKVPGVSSSNQKTSRKKTMTAVALKRLSEERSKMATKNPVVAGVMVRRDDPLLAAVAADKSLQHKISIAKKMQPTT